jgi:lipopolysaccharide export system protein LptC
LWTWIKWASLAISLGSVVWAIWLLGVGAINQIAPVPEDGEDAGQGTQVERPLIVERKGDRMVWRLQADKARQELSGGMHLTNPVLELFTKSGDVVRLQGEEALFHPLTRNVLFTGKVNTDYGEWRLMCEKLAYNSQKDELHIPGRFSIEGKAISMRGKGLTAYRGQQKLVVKQGVWIQDMNPERWEAVQ